MSSPWHLLFVLTSVVWAVTEVYILGIRNQRSGRNREGDERRSSKLLIVLLSAALLLPMLLSEEVRETWLAPMNSTRRFGVALMLAGWALRVTAVWTLGSAWSRDLGRFAFGLRIRVEERILHGLYGEDYARNRERSWRLIPFVY